MDIFVLTLLFCILVISSKWLNIDCNLGKKIIDKLDEYSYCIYLIHPIVMGWAGEVHDSLVKAILIIGGTMILSVSVHEFFEKPIQKRLTGILRG